MKVTKIFDFFHEIILFGFGSNELSAVKKIIFHDTHIFMVIIRYAFFFN